MGRKPKQVRNGVCSACKADAVYVEIDHRVPVRIGGEHDPINLQDLCLTCHREKSMIEIGLFTFYAESADVRRWFHLAFQDDKSAIDSYITLLHLRVSHMREVLQKMENEKDGQPTYYPRVFDED